MNHPCIQRTIPALLLTITTLFINSCTKPDDSVIQSTASIATTINFSDAYGVLDAVRSVSYMNVAGINVPVETNAAIAAFYGSTGSTSLLDAGTVMLNNKSLTKNSGNTYVYQDLLSPLDFSSLQWQVSGSDRIPPINKTVSRPVPSFSGYSSLPTSITKSTGLTIDISGQIADADSVYLVIADINSKWILKRTGNAGSSITFTADELSSLGAGKGMIQVSVFNFEFEPITTSKKTYFVNQSTYSKVDVTIN